MDDYSKHTSSTYAITKYVQNIKIDGLGTVKVDLWDTAGQVRHSEYKLCGLVNAQKWTHEFRVTYT